MKLVYFNDFRLGVLKGDAVVDVTSVVQKIPHTGPGDLMNGLIARFDEFRGPLERAASAGTGLPVAQVKLRPPLPKPVNVDCMAVNYMEDGTRKEPAPINAFHKSPGCIVGHGDTMVLPDIAATIFEGEAELAVVIGKRASNVPAAKAMEYVFGYVNFIDGSARGVTAARQHVLPDEVARLVRADRAVPRDGGRDQGSAQAAGQAVGERPAEAELQHRRHGEQDSALHRVDHRRSTTSSRATSSRPAPITAGCPRSRTTTPSSWKSTGLGRLTVKVRDELKRTWARETRLEREQKGLKGTTPQLTGQVRQGRRRRPRRRHPRRTADRQSSHESRRRGCRTRARPRQSTTRRAELVSTTRRSHHEE